MNFTILSLCCSSLFNSNLKISSSSPIFSIVQPTFYSLKNSYFLRSYSPIISCKDSYGKLIERSNIIFYKNQFKYFLNSIVKLNSDEPAYLYNVVRKDQYYMTWVESNTIIQILFCEFSDITGSEEGMAIKIVADADAIIRATSFKNIYTSYYEGGVVLYGSYGNRHTLYAKYNCFSDCEAVTGSAIKTYSANTEIFFTSAYSCKVNENSKASAPFHLDLSNSFQHLVTNSNLTTCSSIFSAGFYFTDIQCEKVKYLTFFDCSGAFIIDVNKNKNDFLLSNSNFIKCTLKDSQNDQPGLIHISNCASIITDIIVYDCFINAHSNSNAAGKIASVGPNGEIQISEITTDLSENDISDSSSITIVGNVIVSDTEKNTVQYDNVLLIDCRGNIEPPTLEPTPTKSPLATPTRSVSRSATASASASASASETPTQSPEQTWDPKRTPTPSASRSPLPTESNPSLDLTTKEIIATVTTPSLFFLILLGIVVVILLAKTRKRRRRLSDIIEDEEEENIIELETDQGDE